MQPFADSLQRHLLFRHQATLNQHASKRRKGIAIMRIVADAQQGAVLQPYARRSFYLDRQGIGGATQPADFEVLPVERAIFDLTSVVIWQEFAGRRLTEG